jgi:tRNA (cmo5U34)-methyltransferase
VQLARIEDPLPDGTWDLVIGVLSIHHLRAEQKKNLFRQVREQARSFVIGDIVKADAEVAPIDPDYDFPETAEDLAAWSGGTVTWQQDDLAVVQAVY